MTMSIRNQLVGTVTRVTNGAAMSTVKSRLAGGQEITAAITREAADELKLADGSPIRALIKATEVSLATTPVADISTRNQIPGHVTAIASGGAMAAVRITVDGAELTSAITREAVEDLGLTVGSPVVVLIKATEVSLGTA
jgi:molybdate transport system regulatory protein